MSESIQKSGFTKTGFSRSGFACCSRHVLCENGKKECYYKTSEPEVPSLCSAYQREHTKTSKTEVENASFFLSDVGLVVVEKQESKEIEEPQQNLMDDDGQLSLF